MTIAELLITTAGPLVFETSQDEALTAVRELDQANMLCVALSGKSMRTTGALFAEYARAFRFPSYFGGNWAAFEECMTTLENAPAHLYVTLIQAGGALLDSEPAERSTFLRQMSRIGHAWGSQVGLGPLWGGGEVPFHTLIVV